MLAGLAPLPQRLGIHGPEHRSQLGVGDGDGDLHQARSLDDDPVELAAVLNETHELACVADLHAPSLLPNHAPHGRLASFSANALYRRHTRAGTATGRPRPEAPHVSDRRAHGPASTTPRPGPS